MSEKEKETKEKEEKEEEKEEKEGSWNFEDQVGNYLFVGCMFLGGGLGYVFLNTSWWVGWIIGMGFGFLARAVWIGWKGSRTAKKRE